MKKKTDAKGVCVYMTNMPLKLQINWGYIFMIHTWKLGAVYAITVLSILEGILRFQDKWASLDKPRRARNIFISVRKASL